ncbi:MAG: type II secretion system protein [Candidatus Gastranaerophilaceae bacterium]
MRGGGNLLSSCSKGFTLAEGTTCVATLEDNRFSAFTLAEVLVTLGIIGVVAAMTMPVLIGKYQHFVLVNRAKSLFHIISGLL